MKRLLAAAVLASGVAGAWAATTGPIGPGAVPLDGWNRAAPAPPTEVHSAARGAGVPAVPGMPGTAGVDAAAVPGSLGAGAAGASGALGAGTAGAAGVFVAPAPSGTGEAAPAASDAPAAAQATAGTAEDAALGLHFIPDLRPHASPWALLAVAVLALGYVLVKRPR